MNGPQGRGRGRSAAPAGTYRARATGTDAADSAFPAGSTSIPGRSTGIPGGATSIPGGTFDSSSSVLGPYDTSAAYHATAYDSKSGPFAAGSATSTIAMPIIPEGQLSDAELVRRARRRGQFAPGTVDEQEALDAARMLIQRYQTVIYATALRRVRQVDVAQDLTQETFLTALDNLSNLREPDRLRAWLFGILRNHIREAARRHVRRPHSLDERIDDGERLLDRRNGTSLEPAQPAPGKDLEATELAAMLRSALRTIPERYRDILILRYLQGWSVPDIAETLNCTIAAVEVTLHRARKALGEKARTAFKDLMP